MTYREQITSAEHVLRRAEELAELMKKQPGTSDDDLVVLQRRVDVLKAQLARMREAGRS